MRRSCRELFAGSALALVMSASGAAAQVIVPYSNGQINPATITTDRNLGTFLIVNAGDAAEQSGPIVDGLPPLFPISAPVNFFGGGTLTLSGNNTYSSGTVISSGTLIAGSDTAFGTGVVNVNASATIGYLDGVTINNLIALPPFGAVTLNLDVDSGTATQAGRIGAVDPTQSIVKTGAGTLLLPNANPELLGMISITEGTLAIGSSGSLGDISGYPVGTVTLGTVYLNGGTLQAAAEGLTVANDFSLLGVGGAIDTNGYTLTISGDIGDTGFFGSGPLTKTGEGTLVLAGTGTYTHETIIEQGTVQIGSGTALGGADVVLQGGTLLGAPGSGGAINLLNDIVVTGEGGVAAATGTTLTLQGGFAVTPNSVTTFGSATNTGTIVFADSAMAGVDDTASFVIAGGTVKDNIFGDLGSLLGTGQSTMIAAGATVDFSNAGGPGVLPAIRNLTGAGSIITGSDIVFPGGFVIPNFVIGIDGGTTAEFSGVISGPGSIQILTTPFGPPGGAGRVILSGDNTYTGDTYICECSELQVGNGGTTGTINGTVFNAGTLIFNRSNTYVFNNTISDDPMLAGEHGKVVQDGTGMVVLGGTNTYSGGTFLNNGTLSVSSEANLGDLSGALSFDGGILQVTGGSFTSTTRTIVWGAKGGGFDIVEPGTTFTVSQQIDGTGGMVKDGAGTLLLTGDNSYSGGTVIKEGTLSLGTNTAAGTGAITTQGSVIDYANGVVIANPIVIDSNTTQLQVVTGTATQAGAISELNGPRPMEKIGAGNLVLEAVNSYTGGTTVSAGTLTISGAGTLGAAGGKTTVRGGSTLDLGGTSQTQDGGVTLVSGTIKNGKLSSSGVFDLQSGDVSAVLAGAGAVTKTTAGLVTLSGANSYRGGTTVSEGTLKAGAAGAFVNSTAYTVNGGKLDLSGFDLTMSSFSGIGGEVALGKAALTLDQAGDSAFAGSITGTGTFTKSGAGTFTLTGASTYTGATTVAQGTLSVDGSIVSPVTVDDGGILAGVGSVGATVLNAGGVIAPGHSPGTLTVGGSITFGAGSTYAFEIGNPVSDLIAVTAGAGGAGTADLSGGAVAASFLTTGDLQSRYTILTTTGGLGGTTFASLADDQPGIETSLSYDADNAYLDIRVTLDQLSGLTLNQQAVADTLTDYFNANGTLPLALATLDADGLTLASGELATAAIQSNFIAADRFLDEISSRFVLSDSGGVVKPAQEPAAYAPGTVAPGAASGAYAALMDQRSHAMGGLDAGDWQAWGSAYGVSASADGDEAYVGSHDLDASLWGLAAGAGWRDGDSAFGLALGGGGSNFDLDGGLGSGDAGIFNAGVYGLAEFGQAYLSGALAYGYYDVSTSRSLFGETLEANYGAHSFSGRAEAGWRFDRAGVGFTPYAAFQATALSIPDYAETYAGTSDFALSYDGQTANTARGELGLRLDKTIALDSAALKLSGRAAWAHASEPDNSFTAAFQALPGTSFTVIGADAPVDSALLDLGATMAFDNGVAAGLAFHGQFADGYASYSGSARLSIKW